MPALSQTQLRRIPARHSSFATAHTPLGIRRAPGIIASMKTLPLALALTATMSIAAPPEPKFTAQDLDVKIEIGYGLAIADVDGDGKPDILLADKKQFVWYRNPGKRGVAWDKFVLAENLTEKDNVCIAARDIDGSGKCSIAVGAEWNPGDTVKSGAVFYLIPPADRTQKWEAVKFPSVEPTTHRMKWVRTGEKDWGLLVSPLHGRGNKNGEGDPVKTLLYHFPKDSAGIRAEWKSEVVEASSHMTHNFERLAFPESPVPEALLVAGKEGVAITFLEDGKWKPKRAIAHASYSPALPGIGEFRVGWSTKDGKREPFGAAIEPMHGNTLAVYHQDPANPESTTPPRTVLTDKLADGHALACGDVLGTGSDQIVVGWRAMGKAGVKVGVALWAPLDNKGAQWRETLIDDNTMACEDLVLSDLDGDGKLDIVAAGRGTKNVKIYWNAR